MTGIEEAKMVEQIYLLEDAEEFDVLPSLSGSSSFCDTCK